MKIIFITGNEGKLREAREILADVEVEEREMGLPEVQAIDPRVIIEEKLKAAGDVVDGWAMVEDTSLYLDCLNGLPGPLIKWFLKTVGNEGLYKLAAAMGNNGAEAVSWIGVRDGDGKVEFFEGRIRGKIVEPRGENGFGWDKIVQREGEQKTFSQMSNEEKNSKSMRRKALEKVAASLEG